MTKFILHGGYATTQNPGNDSFFREILLDYPAKAKILLVYFAKDEERIPVCKSEDVAQFERVKGEKILTFEIADKLRLLDQMKATDVVYLRGGDTLRLLSALKQFPKLAESFHGKTIAGESAGAYVLSSLFYSKRAGGVFSGLELVPVKTVCHYSGTGEDNFPNSINLETLLLKDFEYKVFRLADLSPKS